MSKVIEYLSKLHYSTNWINLSVASITEQALCILANIADGETAKEFIMSNEDVLRKLTNYMVWIFYSAIVDVVLSQKSVLIFSLSFLQTSNLVAFKRQTSDGSDVLHREPGVARLWWCGLSGTPSPPEGVGSLPNSSATSINPRHYAIWEVCIYCRPFDLSSQSTSWAYVSFPFS